MTPRIVKQDKNHYDVEELYQDDNGEWVWAVVWCYLYPPRSWEVASEEQSAIWRVIQERLSPNLDKKPATDL